MRRLIAARMEQAHNDERGQMAFVMLMLVIVVFMFFALAFDAGLWYFDHRTAQNQAEASALAAVQALPSDDTSEAAALAGDWLERNGSDTGDYCASGGVVFSDSSGDGSMDTVRVCVRRGSPGIFSSLAGIDVVNISAAATARVGAVSGGNVMPWAVIPPDPDCDFDTVGQCQADTGPNGELEDCGTFQDCPFGLRGDRLYGFKSGGGGNTGVIDACGNGTVGYRECIEGDPDADSGFFEEGETVNVGLQGGNLGQNTASALEVRYPSDTWAECDVESTPDAVTGIDADGKAEAQERFVDSPPDPECMRRLVLVPILRSMPPTGGGSADLEVLGVATFGVAQWNRTNNSDAWGTDSKVCTPQQGGQAPDDEFSCGMVWGYLMEGAIPPDFLLERISDTSNPFAPLIIALVE